MAQAKKTDNSHMGVKLALRRHFLRTYHRDSPPRVFDACQGQGLLWNRLQQEFLCASYWGVDMKQKPGRLNIDSIKILGQPGWQFDVIDIDTYGSPWKHWEALLPHVSHPVTIFLTIGSVMMGGGGAPTTAARALGIEFVSPHAPALANIAVVNHALPYCIHRATQHDLSVVEMQEGHPPAPHARYIGVRLTP